MGRGTDTACACARGRWGCGGGEASTVALAALTGCAREQVSPAEADLAPEANAQMAVLLSSQKNLAWAVWLVGYAGCPTKFA